MSKRTKYILDVIESIYPNAKCELNYNNPLQLAIAVALSAQTTDERVNIVTKELFIKCPDVYALSSINILKLKDIIKSIGLANNKAKNLILMAKKIIKDYNGVLPNNYNDLVSLAGIGRKSANVILSECFKMPAIAVDTHVERVSKRLRIAKEDDSILKVEYKLMKKINKKRWHKAHHLLIIWGRYKCKAINPICNGCPLYKECNYV